MAKIRVGTVGMGRRLQGVYAALQAATDQVELVAVCDPSSESLRGAKEKFNPNACEYSDAATLAGSDLDWVMIGSWNCFHKDHAVAALKAKRHVFCEKPLATNLEDCVAIRKAWQGSGTMFVIGFTLRYSPHYRKIREIVQSGVLGQLISMEFNETLGFNHGGYIHGNWRRKTEYAGTHLLEKCCHDIDLVNWMLGSRARRVASFGGCDFFRPENAGEVQRLGKDANGKDAFCTWHMGDDTNPFTADKDIVDNQVAIVEYENGVRTTFHTNCCAAIPERRMYLCGSHGTLRADLCSGTLELQRIGFDTIREKIDTGALDGHGGGDAVLGRELAQNMLRGTPTCSTLDDGMAAAITAFGIDEAMNTGRVVDMATYWRRAGL